jgi:AcrR family transcriptional regulator
MTARGSATRTRLLEATRHVVRDVGYANATTRAIADVAGVAEGTIYRHFPDKLALFVAAAQHGNDAVLQEVEQLPQWAGDRTVARNLTEVLTVLATLRDQVLPLELALLVDPELAARRAEMLAALPPEQVPGPHRAIAAYLVAEQQLGRVRAEVDPVHASVLLLACLLGVTLLAGAGDGTPRAAEVAAAVELIVDGLAAR